MRPSLCAPQVLQSSPVCFDDLPSFVARDIISESCLTRSSKPWKPVLSSIIFRTRDSNLLLNLSRSTGLSGCGVLLSSFLSMAFSYAASSSASDLTSVGCPLCLFDSLSSSSSFSRDSSVSSPRGWESSLAWALRINVSSPLLGKSGLITGGLVFSGSFFPSAFSIPFHFCSPVLSAGFFSVDSTSFS